jgi:hypothetical protein
VKYHGFKVSRYRKEALLLELGITKATCGDTSLFNLHLSYLLFKFESFYYKIDKRFFSRLSKGVFFNAANL